MRGSTSKQPKARWNLGPIKQDPQCREQLRSALNLIQNNQPPQGPQRQHRILKRHTVRGIFQVKETGALGLCKRMSKGGLASLTGPQEGDGRRTLQTLLKRLEQQVVTGTRHGNLAIPLPNCNDNYGRIDGVVRDCPTLTAYRPRCDANGRQPSSGSLASGCGGCFGPSDPTGCPALKAPSSPYRVPVYSRDETAKACCKVEESSASKTSSQSALKWALRNSIFSSLNRTSLIAFFGR